MRTNFQPLEASKNEIDAIEFITLSSAVYPHKIERHVGRCECGETVSLVAFDKAYNVLAFRLVCECCGVD
jgi:hypothetical protein